MKESLSLTGSARLAKVNQPAVCVHPSFFLYRVFSAPLPLRRRRSQPVRVQDNALGSGQVQIFERVTGFVFVLC